MNRRVFVAGPLAGAAAAFMSVSPANAQFVPAPIGLLTAGTLAAHRDPIVPLYQQWVSAQIRWYELSDTPGEDGSETPETLEAEERMHGLAADILQGVPRSMEGMAAVAAVLWDLAGPGSRRGTDEFEAECDEPVSRAIRNLWSAASGRCGLPVTGRLD